VTCSPDRMSPMSVGFRLKSPEEIHAQLEKMSDAELIEHGKTLRALCRPTKGQGIDKGWLMQLDQSRAERSGEGDIHRRCAKHRRIVKRESREAFDKLERQLQQGI
jgi:hypothetical protein